MNKNLVYLFFAVIILSPLVNAQPDINFTDPTPSDGETLNYDSLYINLTTNYSGTHYSLVDIANSLVLWMRMDDIDENGNPLDKTIYKNNGTKAGNANQTADGSFGKGFNFDGDGDYISVPDDNSLDLNSNFTIAVWVKPGANMGGDSNESMIIGKDFFPMQWAWSLFMDDGKIRLQISDTGSGAESSITSVALNLDAWNHVVATFDIGISQQSFYLDGSFDRSSGGHTYSIYNTAQNVTIGARTSGGWNFNGSIDEVMIFNRTLMPQEISALYNATANQYFNNFTNLDDGNYSFIGYAVDDSGVLNETEERIVGVDASLPVLNIGKNVSEVEFENGIISINWTATDFLIDTVEFNITYPNGSVFYSSTSDSGEINFSSPGNLSELGIYTINLWANDSSGNLNFLSDSFGVNDTIFPDLEIISPVIQNHSISSIDFNVFANENLSFCVVSLDVWENNYTLVLNESLTGANYTNSSMGDGSYTANFYCNDTSGNANNTEFVVFSIDTVNPEITIVYPGSSSYNVNISGINYTFSEINPDKCWYSIDSGATNSSPADCGTNWTDLESVEGSNTWSVYINDTAGNENSSSITFSKDTSVEESLPVSSPSGGGGTSGAGLHECYKDSDCREEYVCYNHKCVKLFDVKILKVDSPINQKGFFNFTYSVKSIQEIKGDVIIDFWFEKNNQTITSGSDTIYFRGSEVKEETTQLFLPSTTPDGVYSFYVQATYLWYEARAHRTIEVIYPEIKIEEGVEELPAVKPLGIWNKIKALFIFLFIFIRKYKIYFIILGSLILLLILIMIIVKKFRKRDVRRLSNIRKMEVFATNGDKIGKIKEAYVAENRVYGWLIKVERKMAKKINDKSILVSHKHVESIKDVVVIDKRVSEHLEKFV